MARQDFFFFFLSNWDGAPPGSWCPTQTAYSAYRELWYWDYGYVLMTTNLFTLYLQDLNPCKSSHAVLQWAMVGLRAATSLPWDRHKQTDWNKTKDF